MKKIIFYGSMLLVLAVQGSVYCMLRPRGIIADGPRIGGYGMNGRGLICEPIEHSIYRIDWVARAKALLAAKGNVYEVEPKDALAPLDEHLVMNDYWKSVAATTDKKIKNEALEELLAITFGDHGYYLWRYHFAAALYAGADSKIVTGDSFVSAVLKRDYALCQLLLQKGCDPNVRWLDKPILFYVRTVQLAQLFLRHGASIKEAGPIESLFFQTTQHDYEPGLIQLYKQAGLSVKESYNYEGLLLYFALLSVDHYGSDERLQMLEEKVHALFEGLPLEVIQRMVYYRPDPAHRGTVETLRRKEGRGPRLLENLIQSYLAKQLSVSVENKESAPQTEVKKRIVLMVNRIVLGL